MARSAIHPGDQFAEELKALDMSAAELARQLQVPDELRHQCLYELRLAEQRAGKSSRLCPGSSAKATGAGAQAADA